jgi:hypothetical protein
VIEKSGAIAMCKMPVIPVKSVVDTKRINLKMGGQGGGEKQQHDI